MMAWARQKGHQKDYKDEKSIIKANPRLDEIPFSPKYKYIATLHPGLLLISGAPEVILGMSKVSKEKNQEWQKKFDEAGLKGYRLVGFGYKKMRKDKEKIAKKDLVGFAWLGILVYEDPVRLGVKKALDQCQNAGIKVKVVTGDYVSTAIAVLEQLGFKLDPKTQVMEGEQLEKLSSGQLKKRVSEVVLFARTTPEQKVKIVTSTAANTIDVFFILLLPPFAVYITCLTTKLFISSV